MNRHVGAKDGRGAGGEVIRLTVIKEGSGAPRGSGVYTAYVQAADALRRRGDVSLSVNEVQEATDVIHAHTTMWRFLLVSLRHRARLVVSAHEVPDTYLGSFVLDRLCKLAATHYLRFVYNRARVVIAVSPYVKEELLRLGVRSEIVVLCNSVDRARFRPDPAARVAVRQRLGLDPAAFVVVNAAQVQPRKGVRMFVDVARRSPGMQFVWVGGRPFGRLTADHARLTRLMRDAPPNVHFPGHVEYEQMPGYYAMADACLFPSVQECFGYTIVEAAAAGLPVLLLDNPAYRGYLAPHYLAASTPDAFARLLDRLARDAEYHASWRGRSGELAARHDLERYPDRLVALYRQVAASAPVSS